VLTTVLSNVVGAIDSSMRVAMFHPVSLLAANPQRFTELVYGWGGVLEAFVPWVQPRPVVSSAC
jgi:hypothetical protein